jgi:hypothetical protein
MLGLSTVDIRIHPGIISPQTGHLMILLETTHWLVPCVAVNMSWNHRWQALSGRGLRHIGLSPMSCNPLSGMQIPLGSKPTTDGVPWFSSPYFHRNALPVTLACSILGSIHSQNVLLLLPSSITSTLFSPLIIETMFRCPIMLVSTNSSSIVS